jgi:hypothetical protein
LFNTALGECSLATGKQGVILGGTHTKVRFEQFAGILAQRFNPGVAVFQAGNEDFIPVEVDILNL